MDRRNFLITAGAAAAALAWPRLAISEDPDFNPTWTQIEKRHEEALQRLQQWIRQPSIAAENRGMNEGCELTMRMLREAGFDQVSKVPTDGQPGIFATLDAGATRTTPGKCGQVLLLTGGSKMKRRPRKRTLLVSKPARV
jgi:hypothetical protein